MGPPDYDWRIKARALRRAGRTFEEIAQSVGRSRHAVTDCIRRPPSPPKPVPLSRQRLIVPILQRHRCAWDEVIGPEIRAYLTVCRREIALALRAQGLSFTRIGVILGNRDHSTITNLLGGHDPRPKPSYSKRGRGFGSEDPEVYRERAARVRALLQAGHTTAEVAEMVGISINTVYRYKRRSPHERDLEGPKHDHVEGRVCSEEGV